MARLAREPRGKQCDPAVVYLTGVAWAGRPRDVADCRERACSRPLLSVFPFDVPKYIAAGVPVHVPALDDPR